MESKLWAVVKIRSEINAKPDACRTFRLLNLGSKHSCTIVPAGQRRMLNLVNDFVAFGPISAEFAEKLLAKRGRLAGDKKVGNPKEIIAQLMEGKSLKSTGVKPYIRLHPPTGGYKGSIKKPFVLGGVLGQREDIEKLLEKMM